MMVMTTILSISSSLRGDCRSSMPRYFHTRPVRYRHGGDDEGVRSCGGLLFRSRPSLDGRHAKRDRDAREKKKNGRNRVGKPSMGFRRPAPAVCRVVYQMFRSFGI